MAKIIVRVDAINEAKAAAGFTTEDQLARAVGVHPTQLSRVLSGRGEAGNKFLAGLVRAFGWSALPDLCEIVDDEPAA